MTIKIYPSRLPGEPLEIHQHPNMTIHKWLSINVENYHHEDSHPITIDVDGRNIPSYEWVLCIIKPDSDVRIYPVPHAAGLAIAAIVVAVASVAYMMFFMPGMDAALSNSSGKNLDLNPAKANQAKLGEPIRELFGRRKIYPDYVVPPVVRFDPNDPTIMRSNMLLCLGVGQHTFSDGDIRVGDTPVASLPGFNYVKHEPGANVAGDERSEIWFNSTEVGGTSSGSGLDMAQTAPETDDINADGMAVSGASVSFIGLDTEDDDEDDDDENDLPSSWVAGAVVEIQAPTNFQITTSTGYSVIASKLLTEIAPYVGMPVTLSFGGVDYGLFISTWTPGQDAVPGEGGSQASVQASAAPTTYDFSTSTATFTVTWQGETYTISLVADYVSMPALLAAISEGLTGSGLIATDGGDVVRIEEEASPWQGGSITSSSLPASVFGGSPVFTAGERSTGGSAAILANVTLAYDSATGTPFSGLPEGTQRASLSHSGYEYRIVSVDAATAVVQRFVNGAVDSSWPGFSPRTMVDYEASGINDSDRWMGPFLATPQNEVCDMFEVNFTFPNGIVRYNKKGKKRSRNVDWELQYRVYGSGSGWTSRKGAYVQQNINGLGFTERIVLPSPGLVEVRCRRTNEQGEDNARDQMYWQALRGRLLVRPSSYPDVTLMGVTVETGGKLAAQSDRRVNVVSTRIYESGSARSISGALFHVGNSLGIDMDTYAINSLESTYWTPRGEQFDFATGDSISALEMLQKISNAGMSYFLLDDGLASVGREGIKNWSGVVTPHEMIEELETAFTAPSDDDYDGVDVTYVNGTTWAEETIQCRTSDNPTPRKIEQYTLDGVLDQNIAYRIGMRRLMKYLHQRLSHRTRTELDALVYKYGDRLLLSDDIPGNKTISTLVVGMESDTDMAIFDVTEPLDWSFENPRAIIRYQDGSASSLLVASKIGDGEYQLSVPWQDAFDDIILNDPYIEPPRIIFCNSIRSVYDSIAESIDPQDDGTCQLSARQYSSAFYQHDDDIYSGNIT